MKKLKPWQLALLIIFYPVGIVYLIVWLCKRNQSGVTETNQVDSSKMTVVRDFHTKAVGVTFGNDDGTSRQSIIKSCKVGDEVIFKPVPTKDYPDAIGVFTKKRQQLGHLSAGLATEMKRDYATNFMSATISNITGGNGSNYGCNLHIVIYK